MTKLQKCLLEEGAGLPAKTHVQSLSTLTMIVLTELVLTMMKSLPSLLLEEEVAHLVKTPVEVMISTSHLKVHHVLQEGVHVAKIPIRGPP